MRRGHLTLLLILVSVLFLTQSGEVAGGPANSLTSSHFEGRVTGIQIGDTQVVWTVEIRDLCRLTLKRTEVVVPCSTWRDYSEVGVERSLLVKGKVSLPDGRPATVFPPRKGTMPGGEQRDLAVQFQPSGALIKHTVDLKTSGQGLWVTPVSELGKVLLASGGRVGAWAATLFESGTHGLHLHPFNVAGTQRMDWLCSAFSELEQDGALASRDANPSSGGVSWQNLFSSLDDVADHCPDVGARARLAACAAAYGAVPTQQAWTEEEESIEELVELFTNQCSDGPLALEFRDGLVHGRGEDGLFTGRVFLRGLVGENDRDFEQLFVGDRVRAEVKVPVSEATYTRWYENAPKWMEAQFQEGTLHGTVTEWDEDGSKTESQYQEGWKHGTSTQWREDGTKYSESQYRVGKKHGTTTSWHRNGQKAHEVQYREGNQHGTTIYWNVNGQKVHEVQYREGNQHGTDTYWNSDGRKTMETQYREGKLHGAHALWHANGRKKEGNHFREGKEHGTWTHWREDGQKRSESQYREGKKHGTVTYWHANGKKRSESQFQEGKEHGTVTEWDEDGRKTMELQYRSGTRTKETTWYRNGQMKEQAGYKGRYSRHGKVTKWREDGKKKWDGWYKDGKKNGTCTVYYANGKKKEEGEWTNGEPQVQGTYTYYYENGRRKQSEKYKDDVLVWFASWLENGNPEVQQGRRDDLVVGKHTEWYEDGVKSAQCEYDSNGERHGAVTEWYENGQKYEEGQFKRGERDGWWTTWHENGQKEEEGKYDNGEYVGRWNCWDAWGNHHYCRY